MWPFNRASVSEKLIQELGSLPANTMDVAILGQRENHLVFHYGPRLRKANKVTDGWSSINLTLWNKNPQYLSDGIPALALTLPDLSGKTDKDGNRIGYPRTKIAGDVYLMSTEEVVKLDYQLQNGLMFKRRRVPILAPAVENKQVGTITRFGAFMYIALPSFWHKAMDWDVNFYRGRGNFQVADIHTEAAANRQIQIGNFYKYSPHQTFPKDSVSTHLRSENTQIAVKYGDAAEKEKADRHLLLNPTPEQPRRFIHINSEQKANEDS